MATTYKSTLEINVWKEHACLGCGSRFRYLFQRKKTGEGKTPEAASAAARQAVLNALQHEVDMHPCPGCGLYQPDMIGNRRWTRHWWVLGINAALLLLLLILMLTDVMPANTTALLSAAVCGAFGLIHLLIDRSNPNRDLDANRQAAQRGVERGDLWIPPDSKPQPEDEMPRFGWSRKHTVAYVLFALGVLALLTPEALRMLHGWPAQTQWYPLVAGPGDDPYIYFPDQITSVKGYWRGFGKAQVVNAAELGLANLELHTESKVSNWGEKISVGSRESKTSTNTLWLRVSLPNDARLEGKTLKLHLMLNVTYPDLQGNNFEEVSRNYQHKAEIRLCGAEAGAQYKSWWWGGFVGGVLLIGVSSLTLVRLSSGLSKLALPTTVFAPGEEEGDQAQADEAPEVLPADAPPRRDDDGITRRD